MSLLDRFTDKYFPVTKPYHLQLDTTTVCNLGSCVYCNPHLLWARKPESMPDKMIMQILGDASRFESIRQIRPYVNGDPLAEPRMKWILSECKRYMPEAKTVLYTNGADYVHIDRITDPNLDELHISVSAATPETYLKIHGKPFLGEVVKTHREALRRGVKTWVHFIMCRDNAHELEAWRELFAGCPQNVSDVHVSVEQAASSGKRISGVPETTMNAQKITPNCACNCWNNLSIGVHGEIMLCPDSDYRWNAGMYPQTSLKSGWRKKLELGLSTPPCNSCSLRSSDWRRRVAYSQLGVALAG